MGRKGYKRRWEGNKTAEIEVWKKANQHMEQGRKKRGGV